MYLSVKRSKHALLALGFFVCMFLVIFSTILYVLPLSLSDVTLPSCSPALLKSLFGIRRFFYFIRRYFAERGTWDPILETFIDADGDPTQFSVRILLFSTFVFTDVWYSVHPSCSLVCPHQCVLFTLEYNLIAKSSNQ